MVRSIREYLRERLPEALYESLREASQDFTRPLFAIDPETGRFEVAADLDEAEPGDSPALDALCLACELLSEADLDVDAADPLLEREDEAGEIELTYEFNADEEDVYHRFKALLSENATPAAGFQADFQKYPWGYRVVVRITYASNFDYQAKKDIIDLMLLVAKRRAKDVPLFGKRL